MIFLITIFLNGNHQPCDRLINPNDEPTSNVRHALLGQCRITHQLSLGLCDLMINWALGPTIQGQTVRGPAVQGPRAQFSCGKLPLVIEWILGKLVPGPAQSVISSWSVAV